MHIQVWFTTVTMKDISFLLKVPYWCIWQEVWCIKNKISEQWVLATSKITRKICKV